MNRRNFLKASSAASAALLVGDAAAAKDPIRTRPIPSTEELLPVVGVGTSRTFDVGSDVAARENLGNVLRLLVDEGASVVDSSPMYGSSESVVGDIASELGLVDKLFLATKVWTNGAAEGVAQMDQSFQRMKTAKMDLMQVHNLIDSETHLRTLREWKEQGKIRYIGLSHYHSGGYPEMLRLMEQPDIDFIQINYSLLSTEAEKEIFPLAQRRGIATIINRPYENGRLFARVKHHTVPEWAGEFDCHSWGQFFLKFILAHPAVTCVIPGTSKVHHLADNLAAGRGALPTPEQRSRMQTILAQL